MTLSRMVKDETLYIFIFITLVDFTSSLYLSQSSVTTEPGKSLAISCRDKGGQPVMWKGPKGTLSANTKPKIQDTSIGKLLVFTPTRVQDTGNYTCSLINNKNDNSIFSLIVEEYDTAPETDTDLSIDSETESESSPPIRENRYPPSHRKPHKSHTTKHRQHETTTQDTDTGTETSTFDHPYTRPPHSGHHNKNHKHPVNEAEEPIEFKDTPEVQRGIEGDNFTLRCEVNRPYKISWLLDDNKDKLGTKYVEIGDGLVIYNVSREDNRIFICEALKSSTGQVIDKKIRFIVEHKPVLVTTPNGPDSTDKPPVYAQDEEVYGFLGENVNLTCEVEAEPQPRFEWKSTKQGQKKIGRILNVSTHKSVLQLKMTNETPDKYQCTVSNKHGRLQKFFNLQIGTKADPPGNIELKKAESHSLELTVELPEPDEEAVKNGMEPKWLNIFYRTETAEDWDKQEFNITLDTFILTELNSSTKYEIVAAAKNVAGLSPYSNITFFETLPNSSVQINKPTFFSVVLISTLILLTSKLA